MTLLDHLSELDKGLYIETEKIKEAVTPILANRIHLHYTDHSIEHSLRILELLNQIMTDLMTSKEKLNKYELFILISSIYIHDIGMQFEKFDLLKQCGIEVKNEEISTVDLKLDFIRRNHHTISKIWVIESIKRNPEFREVYFVDPQLGELIALIAESHNINLKKLLNNYTDFILNGTRIRLALLACLIALGDVLDADSRRVDIERLKHIDISQESRLHWWKHYYISGLYYDNGLLNIQYSFPSITKSEQDIYFNYFSSEIKYWLLYNKENFKNILSTNYIRFDINDTINTSLVKQKLIQEDYEYIENYIISSKVSPMERIRQSLSQKLGYKNIEVSNEKDSFVILYQSDKPKIISISKDEYDSTDFQNIVMKIIKEIER